jgi:molybdopterin converting factor subunit 1
MKVDVLFFAAARERAGTARTTVTLADGATVADLWRRLGDDVAALAPVLPSCRAAVDEEFASPATALRDGATVAVLPPVSGG